MSKIKKLLNQNTLDYICAILGLVLTIVALYKKDTMLNVLGFLFIYTNLNSISWNESKKTIKELQKQIDEINSKLGKES